MVSPCVLQRAWVRGLPTEDSLFSDNPIGTRSARSPVPLPAIAVQLAPALDPLLPHRAKPVRQGPRSAIPPPGRSSDVHARQLAQCRRRPRVIGLPLASAQDVSRARTRSDTEWAERPERTQRNQRDQTQTKPDVAGRRLDRYGRASLGHVAGCHRPRGGEHQAVRIR